MANLRIPQLHFKSENNFPALQALERITVAPSLDYIYSTRYRYMKRNARESIGKIEETFKNAPVTRETALHMIGIMCHECIHMSFLKRERNLFEQNAYDLEVEICRFFERLPSILDRFNSKNLRFTVLKWILLCCSHIANYNQKRANVNLAREFMPVFLKFRSIDGLINLLNVVLGMLVADYADEVVNVVVDCFKYGRTFDWILLHIVTSFPHEFIPRLFDICVNELEKRREDVLQNKNPTPAKQSVVISDLMYFLSTKKAPKLRAILFENLAGFFDGSKQIQSFFSVVNLMMQFSEVSSLISEDIHNLINQRNIAILLKIIFSPQWVVAQMIPSSTRLMHPQPVILKTLRVLPLNTLILTYDTLISLIFGPHSLNEHLKLDRQIFLDVCSKIEQLMNDLITIIMTKILAEQNTSFASLPYLEEIAVKNEKRYNELLQDILDDNNNNKSKYSVKLLFISCLIGQREFAVKAICQLLYNAKTENQLIKCLGFIQTLKSQYVHIMSDCLVYLTENIKKFDAKFRQDNPNTHVNLSFMKNLALILEWQSNKNLDVNLDIITDFNFSAVDGYFQLAMLDFLSNALERLILIENLEEDFIAKFVCDWLKYMEKFQLANIHSLDFDIIVQLITKLVSIGVLLIRFLPVATKNETSVLSVCKTYFTYCKHLFCSNLLNAEAKDLQLLNWCLSNFVKMFLENVFDFSHDLFGTTPVLIESVERVAFVDVSQQLLPKISCSTYIPNSKQTCLDQLRSKPFIQRKTAALAHSGTISNKHSKFIQKQWTSIEKLRCTIIVGCCSTFCSDLSGRLRNIENQIYCLVGKTLIELTCPDSLTSTISWLEWSIERECVPLYTEVTNKIRALPLIFDLLLKLSQNGYSTMCSALPLIKSMFSVVVNFHGATPRKFDKLNTTQLEDIARVFSLLFASGILPSQYKSLFEIFKTTTHHETYLILTHLWEYIRLVVPQSIDELQALCNMEIQSTEFTRKANPQLLTTIITPMIQLHIEELGSLLPGLLTDEDNENLENEVW